MNWKKSREIKSLHIQKQHHQHIKHLNLLYNDIYVKFIICWQTEMSVPLNVSKMHINILTKHCGILCLLQKSKSQLLLFFFFKNAKKLQSPKLFFLLLLLKNLWMNHTFFHNTLKYKHFMGIHMWAPSARPGFFNLTQWQGSWAL